VHPLSGPLEKLRRASAHIRELRSRITEFTRDNHPQVLIAELEPDGKYYVLRARIKPYPVEWGTIIGDIAHNLRSALDALMFQLVILNGLDPEAVTPKPSFPIFRLKKHRNSAQTWHSMGRRQVQNIRPEHAAIIERLQPYHRRRGGRPGIHTLWALHELNNADKHRLIQIVGAKSRRHGIARDYLVNSPFHPDIIDHTIWTGRFFEDNRKIGRVLKRVAEEHNPVYFPIMEIAFKEGSRELKGITVPSLVTTAHEHVRKILFAAENFRNAFGPLPAEWTTPPGPGASSSKDSNVGGSAPTG
jgi:hypothetical protein